MRSREEMLSLISVILQDLRAQAGVSRAKMADRMGLDARTYSRYEAGESTPTLADFIVMLSSTGLPVLPTIMRYLYPESFGELSPRSDTATVRKCLAEYILRDASDRDVRQLAYVTFGPHGSTFEAQIQLFCALDHLPMEDRLAIAKLTLNFWEIESERGNIINQDFTMPDSELLRSAIIKAHRAVIEGKTSYVSALE